MLHGTSMVWSGNACDLNVFNVGALFGVLLGLGTGFEACLSAVELGACGWGGIASVFRA